MASEDIFAESELIGLQEEDVELNNEEILDAVEVEVNTETREESEQTKDTEEATGKNSDAAKENATKLLQLPMARIKNLMKLDPDLQLVSNEAVFIVARATELFIESFARESFVYTTQAKKKTIQKRDIDMAIAGVDSLMFLDGAMNF